MLSTLAQGGALPREFTNGATHELCFQGAALPGWQALSDAGVVPDLPAQADEEPVPEGPVLPETGEGAPIE